MDRDQIGALFYGRPEHQRRFTDFPILPDVWIEFGRNPASVPLLPRAYAGCTSDHRVVTTGGDTAAGHL